MGIFLWQTFFFRLAENLQSTYFNVWLSQTFSERGYLLLSGIFAATYSIFSTLLSFFDFNKKYFKTNASFILTLICAALCLIIACIDKHTVLFIILFILFILFEASFAIQLRSFVVNNYSYCNQTIVDNEKLFSGLASLTMLVFSGVILTFLNTQKTAIFFVLASIFFALSISAFKIKNNTDNYTKHPIDKNTPSYITDYFHKIWPLLIFFLSLKIIFSLWYLYQPIFLNSAFELANKKYIGIVFSLISVSAILPSVFFRKLNKISLINTLLVSLVTIAFTTLLTQMCTHIWSLCINYIVVGLCAGTVMLCCQHIMHHLISKHLKLQKISLWIGLEELISSIFIMLISLFVKLENFIYLPLISCFFFFIACFFVKRLPFLKQIGSNAN